MRRNMNGRGTDDKPAILWCACGGQLGSLQPGESVVPASFRGAEQRTLACPKCSKQVHLYIRRAA